ncbi:MAG TPA: hypothetical protein DCO79_05020 [Spirochaeta sp.]|nr:hypothetical protein [Spirochaeta sp.]
MNEMTVLLSLKGAGLSIKRKEKLNDINISICDGDTLGVYGLNGSGKSLLAELLAGNLKNDQGSMELTDGVQAAVVSSAERKRMLEEDRYNDDSEFMEGRIDPGRSVNDIFRIYIDDEDKSDINRYAAMFGISHILDRGIKFLSTGEFRKMMIVSSLLSKPDILILDDPYTGLDLATRTGLHRLIGEIKKEVSALVLISGRLDDLNVCRRLFMLKEGSLKEYASFEHIKSDSREGLQPLPSFTEGQPVQVVSKPEATELIRMEAVRMSYYENQILTDINWRVVSQEHWQIIGPNGSGKSSLLSLINGDSPKAYGQDIFLFGRKRGSGETIWDIKQQIGYVSGALQRQHRISQNVLSVVVSGFFDSIGLYDRPDPVQIEKARDWCHEFGMGDLLVKPFDSLSEGMKRAVLIIRAIVKRPQILILDEPCQGLDDYNSDFVIKIAERVVARDHSTLLYVSHDPYYHMDAIDNVLTLISHSGGGYTGEIS